jgi:hypothetical protein
MLLEEKNGKRALATIASNATPSFDPNRSRRRERELSEE